MYFSSVFFCYVFCAVDLYCLSTQVHEKDNKGVVVGVPDGVEKGYSGGALGERV